MKRLGLFLILTMLITLGTAGPVLAQEDIIPYMESDEIGEFTEPDGESEVVPGPIEDFTTDWVKTEGLFEYYTEEDTRRVLVELSTDQLDREYFISAALSEGTGSEMLAAPMMWGNDVFYFQRDGEMIEVVYPNTQFSTVEGEPIAMALEHGISDFVFARVPIEAEDEEAGRLVIDLPSLLMMYMDFESLGYYVGAQYMVDYDGSYISEIKGFPENDEIDTRILLYGAGDALGYIRQGAQELRLHFSLSEPPSSGYVPRLADDRIGYFMDMTLLYSPETERTETRYVRYINRWRLEKKDPDLDISDPVEPIVYWLENTIPHEYRGAVADGIEFWNAAFEQAGFSNAIKARQMPDDAEWDPADNRYHVIRWFVSPQAMYSIGPCLSDPRTGEIYDADIGINADMISGIWSGYELQVDPIRRALETVSAPGRPTSGSSQVPWNDETRSILEDRNRRFLEMDQLSQFKACEAARLADMVRIRGDLDIDSEEMDKYVYQYIVSLVAHEVGHTLGLRHNFAGSAATPYWKLNNEMWTHRHGLSSSIMDYTSANISPFGEIQGEYWQTTPGDYDRWAIEYGYAETGAENPVDEIDALNEIASRSPEYRYATDEDYAGWSRNMDPDLCLWDLCDDPVRYYRDRLTASNQIISRILDYYSEPGNRTARIRLSFLYAFWDYHYAVRAIPRMVGGVRMYRDHIGDPGARPSHVPVSAEEQRKALEFLRDNIWASENFEYDPELLTMMGRDRLRSFNYSNLVLGTLDLDIHALVLGMQETPFVWLYDGYVLERIINNEKKISADEEVFTLVELFDTVRESVWTELLTNEPVDSYRRNLQRSHLETIHGIVLSPSYNTPDDAVALARRDLTILQSTIGDNLNSPDAENLDTMTVAHLEDCLATINAALEAPMERGGSGFMFIF